MIELSKKYNFYIIEDDYLADFADEICVHRDPVARALKDLFAEI